MVESKINALIENCCEEDRHKADNETVNNMRE
jgi:predicted DNA-binding protein